jgi:hypothetical protein
LYAKVSDNFQECSTAREPEAMGSVQMLGASAESSYAEVLHPAFISEYEEEYEMAY